jgi:hypothetical protein
MLPRSASVRQRWASELVAVGLVDELHGELLPKRHIEAALRDTQR